MTDPIIDRIDARIAALRSERDSLLVRLDEAEAIRTLCSPTAAQECPPAPPRPTPPPEPRPGAQPSTNGHVRCGIGEAEEPSPRELAGLTERTSCEEWARRVARFLFEHGPTNRTGIIKAVGMPLGSWGRSVRERDDWFQLDADGRWSLTVAGHQDARAVAVAAGSDE